MSGVTVQFHGNYVLSAMGSLIIADDRDRREPQLAGVGRASARITRTPAHTLQQIPDRKVRVQRQSRELEILRNKMHKSSYILTNFDLFTCK